MIKFGKNYKMVLAIIIATLIKGNRLLAVSGTWISNPMTYFPLYWFNYQVGCYLLGHDSDLLDLSQWTVRGLWSNGLIFMSRLFLGSALVGFISGVIIGLLIYLLLTFMFLARICH